MKRIWAILLLAFLVLTCKDSMVDVPLPIRVEHDNNTGRTYLIDATGKSWEITHAINEYGFEPQHFEFGVGPFAIKPILDPVLICRGEAGYPDDDWERIMIATTIGQESRAYNLTDMIAHEIVDEVFADAHVAIAY